MKKTLVSLALIGSGLFAQPLSLEDAVKTALENNRNLKISKTALQIADAQYQQALSSRYPQLTATASAMRMDQDPSFRMKGSFALPQEFSGLLSALVQDVALSGGTNTLPYAMNPASLSSISSVPIDMDVKLMDRDLGVLRLDLLYPLYTGGKLDAIIKQAALNKSIQSEENRRSESEVIHDVKRYYYGVILAQKLSSETHDTLERMRMVKDLTESFYTGGSMKVKKTDFLRTTTTVALIESMDEEMRSNIELAKSALVNAMGLPWDSEIEIAQNEFESPQLNPNLQVLVNQAHRFNPMMNQLRLAIDIHEAKIDEASSGYLPSVALTADVQHLINSYDAGSVDDINRNSWTIGIGLQWNLFDGYRTTNAVQEAKLNKLVHTHKEVLLKEGLALQVKHAFLSMGQTGRQYKSLSIARDSAAENADLNIRAYQEDMVETKDVIEAQIMETLTKMAYQKNLHSFALAKAQLEYIIANVSKSE